MQDNCFLESWRCGVAMYHCSGVYPSKLPESASLFDELLQKADTPTAHPGGAHACDTACCILLLMPLTVVTARLQSRSLPDRGGCLVSQEHPSVPQNKELIRRYGKMLW
jgi:hypothetical protein